MTAALRVPERTRPWIDGVNPVTRIVIALVLSVPLFATLDPMSASVAIVLELACVPLTGLAWGTVLRRLVPVVVFAPVAGVSMLLYAKPGGTVYGQFLFATVSDDSIALSLAVMLAAAVAVRAADWPEWRGPGRTGVSTETNRRATWS